jgi:hypothetical protein
MNKVFWAFASFMGFFTLVMIAMFFLENQVNTESIKDLLPPRVKPVIIYDDWKNFRLYEVIIDGNKIIVACGNGINMLNLGKVNAENDVEYKVGVR